MKGQFIVLEGPDGAGTTTHAKLLAETLIAKGRQVVLTAEPSEGAIGKRIRDELKKGSVPSPAALQLLFCADRAEHVESVILPALRAGKTVISDRYATSTIIYGHAMGLDAAWLLNVNAQFPKPDLLFLLLPGFDQCMLRIGHRSEKDVFEAKEIQKKVYEGYESLADETANDKNIIRIDSSQPRENTAMSIAQSIVY